MDITNEIKQNRILKAYGGANGNKVAIELNNELYMIKFPPVAKKNMDLSYSNSNISEHVGSTIFNILGIQAQETKLYKAVVNNKDKIVVACKDFTQDGSSLYEFSKIKNGCIDSSRSGSGTELSEIMAAIHEQPFIDEKKLNEFFWDMFVVDAYLGNFDRHNGNWGLLVKNNKVSIAPVYDCGSCLFPQMDDETMKHVLSSTQEFNTRIFNYPTSQIKCDNKKINYYQFLNTTEDYSALKSVEKMAERISKNKQRIKEFILNEELISPLQKEFYCKMLDKRNDLMIQPAYRRAKKILSLNNELNTYDTLISTKCEKAIENYDEPNISLSDFKKWCATQIKENNVDVNEFVNINNEKLVEGFLENRSNCILRLLNKKGMSR